ncbi:type II secretion system protein M [Butyrivibrio sp. AC2005]|uniref:type II secretion system protein M n=1 Tax=Butyrivibrio sp. AC2005 TaxID=1280672 RepID=UPI00040EB4CF|nr:type II secretion system protein M [Butyrivibrio sp. AC2005]
MNILNKAFTKSEKILLVILFIIILGALYYLLVSTPIEQGIQSAIQEQNALTTELEVVQNKLKRINDMSEALNGDEVKSLSYLPSYNAGKDELDFLHALLSDTINYSVKFTKLTRNGDLIRREFEMGFTVKNFTEAEEIIEKLESSEIRCLVNNVVASPVLFGTNINDDEVTVSLTGDFYETMQGGTPDKELPEDESEKNNSSSDSAIFGF